MKYVMALSALALWACGGSSPRAPANEPVSTTRTTSAAPIAAAPVPAPPPPPRTPNLRDPEKTAPNAPIVAVNERDRTLGTKIRQDLEASHVDGWNRVRMLIHDGHVVLVGELPTVADSCALEQVVREVEGVGSVTNQIQVNE